MFSRMKASSLLKAYETEPLSMAEADHMFEFQMTMSNPKQIGPATFCVMGIGDVKTTMKATQKLNKMGILLSSRNQGGNGIDDILVTDAISPEYAKKLKFLPSWQQKKLLMVLFAWQEELTRFRLLEEEMTEIKTIMTEERNEGNNELGQYEIRLLELQGIWRLKPSLRLKRNTDATDILPDYSTGEQQSRS